MRKSLCLLVVSLLLTGVARSDVLTLSSGGTLKGTLQEVKLFIGGDEKTVTRGDIETLRISRAGRVVLETRDGKQLRATLLALRFKSVGGELTFQREDVSSVKLVTDPLAAARKEYVAKREAVGDNDAAGLIELAEWCGERGLKAEGVACARACLKADPDTETAEKAHKLLGHVRYKGEWMTPAEAVEKKQEEGGDAGPVDPESDPDNAAPTDEQLRAVAKQNDDLCEVYKKRADDAKDKELAELKTKYGVPLENTRVRIKTLAVEIREREKQRDEAREQHRKELQAAHRPKEEIERLLRQRFDHFNSEYNKKIRATEEALLKAKVERTKLVGLYRPALDKVRRRASRALSGVELVFQRHKRLLREGRLLTTEKMTKAYEAVFGDD